MRVTPGFNPHPISRPGATPIGEEPVAATIVSILTRSHDRVQLANRDATDQADPVSILTRSHDRVQLLANGVDTGVRTVSILTRSHDRVQP